MTGTAMRDRMNSFWSRFVILWCVLTTATRGIAAANDKVPKFVLVEDHNHVVSHLVNFARDGTLKSHQSIPKKERNKNGAILIHVDSHADMGLAPGLNQLPAEVFSELPPQHTDQDIELLEHSEINDFLLTLGHMGIVDHIIFIEPPWSVLLPNTHFGTFDISIAIKKGEEKQVYGSVQNFYPFQQLPEGAEESIGDAMGDESDDVKIVTHSELYEYCREDCTLRTVKFTTVPYQGAAESIKTILDFKENKDRDIILDIDLDGFSTTSPGAMSLFHSMIPDYQVLTRIFHTVHHELCDMDKEYWERLKETHRERLNVGEDDCVSKEQNFVHGSAFVPPTKTNPSERARDLVEDLFFYYKIEDHGDYVRALAEVFEHYLPAIDAWTYGDDKFIDLLNAFLLQPFYVPKEDTIKAVLDFHFDNLFRTIFEDHTPAVVNVVRSPFYTSDHLLKYIECQVFDRLFDMFGDKSGESPFLYHHDEVLVDRNNCLNDKVPLSNRFNIGRNSNIDANNWRWTHKVFTWFMETDDDFIGSNYRYNPISIDFVNEHKHPVLVKQLHGESFIVPPGKRLTKEAHHMTRWDLYEANDEKEPPTNESFQTMYFNGKKGLKQSQGSISGSIPVYDSTPVRMLVANRLGKGIHITLKNKESIAKLSPGESITLPTKHGELWSIHKVFQGLEERLGEVIANATHGDVHPVRLLSNGEL